MRKAIIAFVILAIAASVVFADGDVGKGKWLHDKWLALQQSETANARDLAFFDGFVISAAQVGENASPRVVSIPHGTTLGQIFKVVGAYLETHPECWTRDAGAVVIDALKTAYSPKK